MAKTMTNKHNFETGDILVSTWGYDQTNVDFFQVERVSGRSVWMRKMEAVITPNAPFAMAGTSLPKMDAETSEKLVRVRAQGNDAGRTCSKWDGKPERCSWYA